MIDNFNWPVQREDVKRFADDITIKTILFIKKNKQLQNELDFISINYRFIINDIINVYVAKKFLSYKQETKCFFDNLFSLTNLIEKFSVQMNHVKTVE